MVSERAKRNIRRGVIIAGLLAGGAAGATAWHLGRHRRRQERIRRQAVKYDASLDKKVYADD